MKSSASFFYLLHIFLNICYFDLSVMLPLSQPNVKSLSPVCTLTCRSCGRLAPLIKKKRLCQNGLCWIINEHEHLLINEHEHLLINRPYSFKYIFIMQFLQSNSKLNILPFAMCSCRLCISREWMALSFRHMPICFRIQYLHVIRGIDMS